VDAKTRFYSEEGLLIEEWDALLEDVSVGLKLQLTDTGAIYIVEDFRTLVDPVAQETILRVTVRRED
jgi:hypothetical protein